MGTCYIKQPHETDPSRSRLGRVCLVHRCASPPKPGHPPSPDKSTTSRSTKGLLSYPAGSAEKSTALRYAYSLEFDKNLTLRDISQEQKSRAQKEFINDSIRVPTK